MIHVGIDEAGYGPTLGPLVVSAAAFKLSDSTDSAKFEGAEAQPHAPMDICPIDLWETLKKVVTRKPDRSRH